MRILYSLVKILFLFPLSVIYGAIVWVRNRLYDNKILPSREFPLPLISIGNITVGGTGKTIHVEHLITILKDLYKTAMLSRGYRRHSSGFLIADQNMDYKKIGDEPRQIKHKFPDVLVAVDTNRRNGIEKIMMHDKDIEAVVLDDAFQHRRITPGLNILLIDYNQPLDKDYILPLGRMREHSRERKRADIIIISKVPTDTRPIDLRIMEKHVKMFAFQKIFFTMLQYSMPVPVFNIYGKNERGNPLRNNPSVLLVTGIANAKPLKDYLKVLSDTIKHIEYPDHYSFDALDMRHLIKDFESMPGKDKYIITTEKDAMRFQIFDDLDEGIKEKMFYVPVSIGFMENQEENFKNQILNYVNVNKSDNILHKKAKSSKAEDGDNIRLRTGWIDERYRR
jgi:tetraacyldisaccharide 4'-kinase